VSDDSRDDARKIVLARRARFVAATVASFGLAACSDPKHPPMPCLEPIADPDAGVDAGAPEPQVCLSVAPPEPPEPQPCLSPMPPPQDAGAPIATDPTPPATATPKKPLPPKKPPGGDPMPCLSVAPKQPPRKR